MPVSPVLPKMKLIVTHTRKLKRVHKLGQYSEVHKCVCVYLEMKPNLEKKPIIARRCTIL